MTKNTLETRAAVLTFLAAAAARNADRDRDGRDRFILDRWGYGDDRTWSLEIAGTGSSWRPRTRVFIPASVGEELERGWNTSKHGHFVGARSPERILKDLGVRGAAAAAKKIAAERAAERQRTRDRNSRNYLRKMLTPAPGADMTALDTVRGLLRADRAEALSPAQREEAEALVAAADRLREAMGPPEEGEGS